VFKDRENVLVDVLLRNIAQDKTEMPLLFGAYILLTR
jgi:hypothetical protein